MARPVARRYAVSETMAKGQLREVRERGLDFVRPYSTRKAMQSRVVRDGGLYAARVEIRNPMQSP